MANFYPEYHMNPSQRTPCMLVLDTSGSMGERVPATGRRRIDELNDGLAMLQQELQADDTAAHRVQIAIVRVGGPASDAKLVLDWTDAMDFEPPRLAADGATPLAAGMQLALDVVALQKIELRRSSVGFTRPWIIVISDGAPTDGDGPWHAACEICRHAEREKHCVIYPMGVSGADVGKLQGLSANPVMRLSEARFKEYFLWLSSSLQSLSRSSPGDNVQLGAVDPWLMVGGARPHTGAWVEVAA